MTRSSLSTKFHRGAVAKYEKTYKENYKKEEGKPFKGNVIQQITLGVIQQKGLPEIGDVLNLIKLGNMNCDNEQAELILDRWLENEENQARGLVGAFCDLCNDICIDIPIHPILTENMKKMEETINSELIQKEEMQNKFRSMLSQLKDLQNLNADKDKTGVSESNTQE